MKNEVLKIIAIGGKLALICAVAASLLGYVNSVTEPKILAMKAAALKKALQVVSMGYEAGEKIPLEKDEHRFVKGYYPVYDSNEDIKGYILELSGEGYAGALIILTGITLNGEVLAVVLMDNEETPGLGKEAEKPEYMRKFINTGAEVPVPVRKDMLNQMDADAITGSTITFIGIGKALEAGSEYVSGVLVGGGK